MNDASAQTDVGPEQARELVESGEALIVDVRQPEEWDAGRIPGSTHIEMNELSGRAGELPSERTVIFACKSGSRSSLAVQAFREAGYDARNLDGGITAWAADGLPLEPENGEVVSPLPAPR
ncbi:rhodanese-like domain-containing protein [Thermoleophilia bacterium SCSIO 60948]|nr:rhodanese-like domain-containing protein [Thermoleophilia bacterium SCSIO 60948]